MFIGNDARTMLLMGVNKVADFVSATMGPGGKCINIRRGNNNHITKDGVTVAKYFDVKDPAEKVGVDFIVEAAQKTVMAVGDGTTTTTVMARTMMLDSHQRLAFKKLNANRISKEMVKFSEIAIKHIEAQSIRVTLDDEAGEKLLVQVGTISANGDQQMAEMCLQAIKAIGPEPNNINFTPAEFDEKDTMQIKSGMTIPGRVGAEILGAFSRRTLKGLDDNGRVGVLIVPSLDSELTFTHELKGYLETLTRKGHGLIVICKQPANNFKTFIVNGSERFQTGYLSPSLHGNKYTQLCEDLIILTGATELPRVDEEINPIPKMYLGYCETVEINRDGITVVKPQRQDTPEHETLIETVKSLIKEETNSQNRAFLKDRLARLTNGVANIRVTHTTESDMYERLDRYDDCVRAMITALNTGIVRGGGAAYLSAAYQLLREEVDPLDQERKMARDLVEAALITPFNVITTNALNYIPRINGKLLVNETNLTIDVWSGEFIDAFENGIFDPLGVQVTSIRSAIAATSVFLNTGGMYQGSNDFM